MKKILRVFTFFLIILILVVLIVIVVRIERRTDKNKQIPGTTMMIKSEKKL